MPVELGRIELPERAEAVAVDGQYAYAICPYAGLYVVSVADPAQPALLSTLPLDGYSRDLMIVDDMVYIASKGLRVVSIANPLEPVLVSTMASDSLTRSVVVRDDLLLLGEESTLRVISVADSENPVELGRHIFGLKSTIGLYKDYAIVALEWRGVVAMSLADPSHLAPVASLDTADRALGIDVVDDLAYVADQHGGLYILRVVEGDDGT